MSAKSTPTVPAALLSLVRRVKENYQEPPPAPPKRGEKRDFSPRSFLLPAAVAVTPPTFSNSELRKPLEVEEDKPETDQPKQATGLYQRSLDCARWRIPSG
jgi:hypothetical protein